MQFVSILDSNIVTIKKARKITSLIPYYCKSCGINERNWKYLSTQTRYKPWNWALWSARTDEIGGGSADCCCWPVAGGGEEVEVGGGGGGAGGRGAIGERVVRVLVPTEGSNVNKS